MDIYRVYFLLQTEFPMLNWNARQITYCITFFLDILWIYNFLLIYVESSDFSQAPREISLSWLEGNIREVFCPKYRLGHRRFLSRFHDMINGYLDRYACHAFVRIYLRTRPENTKQSSNRKALDKSLNKDSR